VSRLSDMGRSTSVSAELEQANVHYTSTAWMPFDAREGPNQPVLLDISYAVFPYSHPNRDFSVVLLRFLRLSDFAAGNRRGWLTSDTKGGSYLRGFITYAQVMMRNGLSFVPTATQSLIAEGLLTR
jgi:hypothetical protein